MFARLGFGGHLCQADQLDPSVVAFLCVRTYDRNQLTETQRFRTGPRQTEELVSSETVTDKDEDALFAASGEARRPGPASGVAQITPWQPPSDPVK